ncbi:hypothetical protein IKG20_02740 [Candidatus Saccharibacteria bacterium]|nr:hypothetical protein [Candidatus Saccharibacteria bacterium]
MKNNQGFKRGATSIYVVIVTMLLLSVITASFIRIIIKEATKTTDDHLSQSAYDSALAGVEDAKIALKQYYDCTASDEAANTEECKLIVDAFRAGFAAVDTTNPEGPNYGYCDVVADALGRVDSDASVKEVLIREVDDTAREGYEYITQAYTCIMIDNTLGDYRSILDSSTPMRIIPLKTENPSEITGLKISWYTSEDGSFKLLNYNDKEFFHPYGRPSSYPPTISARIIQTAIEYKLEDFDEVSISDTNPRSNNGEVFLVPTNTGNKTHIDANTLVKSNDHSSTNLPQQIKCGGAGNEEFACYATLALPKPIGGDNRNRDTFYLVLNLPYDQPRTTFSIQLCKDTQATCSGPDSVAEFVDAQIAIDATGRASNVYSRVEARVEFNDIYYPHPRYTVQGTGGSDDSVNKNFYVTDDCIRWNTDGTIAGTCPNSGDEPSKL